jgi:hypothetical protein
MERIAKTSPNFQARTAGVLYVLAVITAVLGEFIIRGELRIAAVVMPISCYIGVTLFLYWVFKPVNRGFSLLAAGFGLVGLTFEALRLQPRGVNIGMIFHGFFCLVVGGLILSSGFLPRVLGALMVFAGVVWLIYFSPLLARFLAPYNTAVGLIAEALPMLWLLVMGINVRRWKEQPSAVGR